jgi:hypothetical protein
LSSKAGGKDNGGPGTREKEFGKPYETFIHDLEGNNVEVMYVQSATK